MQSHEALTITHVTRQFDPGIGGLENFVKQLATMQRNEGKNIRIISLDRIFNSNSPKRLSPFEVIDGMNLYRIRYIGSKRYPVAPSILKFLKDTDIIHVHAVDFFCDFISITKFIHRKPIVLTTHGGFFHTSFLRLIKKIYFATVTRSILAGYDAVAACSAEDARIFRQIRKAGVIEIENGVDIAKFSCLANRSSSTIIYFGRFAPNKQIIQAIRWFAGLAGRHPEWRLIVTGRPMGVNVRDIENAAQESGVEDRVEIHASPSDGELAGLIARSSAYVCASSFEGFGLAAVEAASAGLYPVLSDIAPFRNTIDRLGFGSIVNFNAPDSWAASYPAFLDAMAAFRLRASDDFIRESVTPFGWTKVAADYDRLYSSVLARRAGTRSTGR